MDCSGWASCILEQQSTDGQAELHKNLCQKILQLEIG